MSRAPSADPLPAALDEALELLRDHGQTVGAGASGRPAEPLPELLPQIASLCAADPGPAPIRAIYHLACTGGTLISRCLATLPNTTLLSELDPLSGLQGTAAKQQFRPSDVIYGARFSLRPPDNETITGMFCVGLRELYDGLTRRGGHLVVRAHSHSQFCTDADPGARPGVHTLLQRVTRVRGVVTVRHPLDSYLSLTLNGWRHFDPKTLDEYARRYLMFLDAHADLALFRYEDFTAAPDDMLARICAELELPAVNNVEELYALATMSGDSGRHSRRITPRPRRAVPPEIALEARECGRYSLLCERLGYQPEPDELSGDGHDEAEGDEGEDGDAGGHDS